MGEIAKKWLAGFGAALVVAIVAFIAIGRTERKPVAPVLSPVTANKSATPSQVLKQTPVSQNTSTSPSPHSASEMTNGGRNHEAAPPTVQNAARISVKSQSSLATKHGMSAASKAATLADGAPASSAANLTTQSQTAQASVPAAPPDMATPLPQTTTAPTPMPVSQPDGMNVTGNVNVNGTLTKLNTLVYPNDQVLTPGENGALATAKGNAIALGANSQFKPESMNSFQLDAGASNVSTKTGMTTKVKDWMVQPVHPDAATQYEVTYADDGVYVYARVNDVDVINSICGRTVRLEQGKVIRISSTRGCGVVWLDQTRTWPYKAAWGTAVGTGTGVIIWLATRQDMSPDHP